MGGGRCPPYLSWLLGVQPSLPVSNVGCASAQRAAGDRDRAQRNGVLKHTLHSYIPHSPDHPRTAVTGPAGHSSSVASIRPRTSSPATAPWAASSSRT